MDAYMVAQPGGLDKVGLGEVADPGVPGPGEIRVAIKAHSINYHDLLVAMGVIPTEDGRILLADGAGVVEAVGEGVREFAVGDHVVSVFFPCWLSGPPTAAVRDFSSVPGDGIDGMAARHVVRSVEAFTHAPKGWSHAEAATITTSGLTAWRALVVDGGLKAGATVLVQGTGGVSIAALQLAKGMGARVIATSSSDEKLERVKALGADHAINYKQDPTWGETAFALADGLGVDHVIEVGGPETMVQALSALKIGGHIAQIGLLTGMEITLPIMLLLARQARVQALAVGSRQDQQDYVRALDAIGERPVIDRIFPVAELPDAFRHMQAGRHFGKICLEW